jgi:hypothetical protein
LCVPGKGLGRKRLERWGAPLNRGVGVRSPWRAEIVAAVNLGQPRAEALEVGLGLRSREAARLFTARLADRRA